MSAPSAARAPGLRSPLVIFDSSAPISAGFPAIAEQAFQFFRVVHNVDVPDTVARDDRGQYPDRRAEFLQGREEIRAFLRRNFEAPM